MAKIIFEGTAYQTHGELPAVGSRAPDVSLVNTNLQDVSLANFMGMRKVLNIFPSIDTPVCAKSVIVFNKLAIEHDDVAKFLGGCPECTTGADVAATDDCDFATC